MQGKLTCHFVSTFRVSAIATEKQINPTLFAVAVAAIRYCTVCDLCGNLSRLTHYQPSSHTVVAGRVKAS